MSVVLVFCQMVNSIWRPVRSDGSFARMRYAPSTSAGSVAVANGCVGRSDHRRGRVGS